jgi:hypothetical protein
MSEKYYLYVKTHNVTGLKYLGQTKRNPFEYQGSGKYWKNHIEKHGYDITTEILLITENKKELIEAGKFYSDKFDIVKSSEWANLIEEKGPGGTFKGKHHSEETKAKWSENRKYICWHNGISQQGIENIRRANSKPKTEDHKIKLRNALLGKSYDELQRRSLTADEKEKISASKRGKPRSEETKQKIRETLKKRFDKNKEVNNV